jgi:hypothetical protein
VAPRGFDMLAILMGVVSKLPIISKLKSIWLGTGLSRIPQSPFPESSTNRLNSINWDQPTTTARGLRDPQNGRPTSTTTGRVTLVRHRSIAGIRGPRVASRQLPPTLPFDREPAAVTIMEQAACDFLRVDSSGGSGTPGGF